MGSSNVPEMMRAWKWTGTEKSIARKAFERALDAELEALISETKVRAARIAKVDDLWKLEGWLGKRRREIDDKFDYRYSVLPQVFAVLISKGQLSLEELRGIVPEKLDVVERLAGFYNGERKLRFAHSEDKAAR